MNKIKFYLIIDSGFIFFALFFILYAIFKYNGLTFTPALLLACFLSALLTCLYVCFQIFKSNKITNKNLEKELKTELTLTLAIMEQSKVLELFLQYYKALDSTAFIDGKKIVLEALKCYAFPIFTVEKLTTIEVIKAYKQTKKGYKTKVLYSTATSEVSLLNLDIELYDITAVYTALKNRELLPKLNVKKAQKVKILPILKNLFKKQKAGKFLLFGVLTLLFSTITFFPLYYIIIGSSLIVIALVLKFFAPFEKPQNIGL